MAEYQLILNQYLFKFQIVRTRMETINLGVNYYELNYDRCVGFLEMLPNCLK